MVIRYRFRLRDPITNAVTHESDPFTTLEGRQLSIRQFTREGWHRIERFEESISERTTQNSGGGVLRLRPLGLRRRRRHRAWHRTGHCSCLLYAGAFPLKRTRFQAGHDSAEVD